MKRLFQPGISGNPAGRPKAQPDPLAPLREQIAHILPELLDRQMAQVRSGSVSALADLVRLLTALQEASNADRGRKSAPAK